MPQCIIAGGALPFTRAAVRFSDMWQRVYSISKAGRAHRRTLSCWAATPRHPLALLLNVSSHSFLLSNNTDSAISTVDVALAIWMRGTESMKVEQILPLANAAKSGTDITAGRVVS